MDPFFRIRLLLGREAFDRLVRSRVTVIGLGAVGSYAVEGLARAGVGSLRLVDFDRVTASNINRQLYALHSTVGRTKVSVALERVRDINPDCRAEAAELFAASENFEEAVGPSPDLVVDAIDSFTPKTSLIEFCWKKGIPVFSSMGAALRTDPFSIRWGDLFDTSGCPLSLKLRKALRKRGVGRGVMCVSSVEPVRTLAPEAGGEADSGDLPFERGRRRRPLGSLPTLTAIFGMVLAQKAIEFLCRDVSIPKK